MFLDLCLDESDGFARHIQDTAFEDDIFDDIHLASHFLFRSIIADETHPSTLEKALWIFSEQQYGGTANLFLAIFDQDIITVGAKKSQRIFFVTNPLAILRNKVQIQIINRCPCNGVILIILHPFRQHNLHTVVEGEFLGFVADTIIGLIGRSGVHGAALLHFQN